MIYRTREVGRPVAFVFFFSSNVFLGTFAAVQCLSQLVFLQGLPHFVFCSFFGLLFFSLALRSLGAASLKQSPTSMSFSCTRRSFWSVPIPPFLALNII